MSWKPSAADRRWKRLANRPHLEQSCDNYGVRTRCRECKRVERGHNEQHWPKCSHYKEEA